MEIGDQEMILLPADANKLLMQWPSCLDRGALINADAPGCGGSRPDGAQVGRFSSWGTVVPKGFLTESAYFSSRISHSAAS